MPQDALGYPRLPLSSYPEPTPGCPKLPPATPGYLKLSQVAPNCCLELKEFALHGSDSGVVLGSLEQGELKGGGLFSGPRLRPSARLLQAKLRWTDTRNLRGVPPPRLRPSPEKRARQSPGGAIRGI